MAEAGKSNTKKTFFSGVLLLGLSTVLVKIIGLIYKIPMLAYLGSEGMGYFNSAYEIYALFCVIATAGLPVALSVVISGVLARGEQSAVNSIYRAAMAIFFSVGTLGTLIMMLFAHQFCNMIRSESAYACILSISPTVFFVCISSALRGYFQGYQRMLPTALSQILESAGKLVFGLGLARYALEKGYDTAVVAAFAGAGLTFGTALSCGYLLLEKLRFQKTEKMQSENKKTDSPNYREIWKNLARLSIPMTLGASLVSLTKLIDMTMILRRLQSIGYTEITANEAYGSYTTLALSVYGLLPALVNAIALPLVPLLSAAIASKDLEKQEQIVRTSYQLTSFFAIPAAIGLAAYAQPVLRLLFGGEPQAVAVAAPLLSYLGVSVFLSCMITATNSVLHAYQTVNLPIIAMLCGAAVKIVSAYFLIGNPRIALVGAPVSTFLCNAAVVLMNLFFAERLCHAADLRQVFLRPLYAAILSVGISCGIYYILTSHFAAHAMITLVSITIAVVFYLLFACLLGVLREEDILALPFGNRLCRMLRKIHLPILSEKGEIKHDNT